MPGVAALSMTASKVGDSLVGALRPACRAEPRAGGRATPGGHGCGGSEESAWRACNACARCACSANASGALPRAGRGGSSSARCVCSTCASGTTTRAGGEAELRVGGGVTPQKRAGKSSQTAAARAPRAHTLVRFRAPSGERGCFVRGCFGEKSILFYSCACSACVGSSAGGEARPGQREQRLPRQLGVRSWLTVGAKVCVGLVNTTHNFALWALPLLVINAECACM